MLPGEPFNNDEIMPVAIITPFRLPLPPCRGATKRKASSQLDVCLAPSLLGRPESADTSEMRPTSARSQR